VQHPISDDERGHRNNGDCDRWLTKEHISTDAGWGRCEVRHKARTSNSSVNICSRLPQPPGPGLSRTQDSSPHVMLHHIARHSQCPKQPPPPPLWSSMTAQCVLIKQALLLFVHYFRGSQLFTLFDQHIRNVLLINFHISPISQPHGWKYSKFYLAAK
jgi:hypothetical protein